MTFEGVIPPRRRLDHSGAAYRMAALCHDIGHLPSQPVPPEDLFTEGWSHERLTMDLGLRERRDEEALKWH